MESKGFNLCDSVGNGDGGQACASFEGITTYVLDVVRHTVLLDRRGDDNLARIQFFSAGHLRQIQFVNQIVIDAVDFDTTHNVIRINIK